MMKFSDLLWRIGEKVYFSKCRDYLPDNIYLRHYWYQCMGTRINFKNPRTFNEKLHWLKLYDRNPFYTKLVDKYEVKEWVSELIGKEYIIPTLGLYSRIEEININALPDEFVIKCNHDSGSTFVCKEKNRMWFDRVLPELQKALKQNYYLLGREWPYKNVHRRIIVEKLLVDSTNAGLRDYKFFCFNGLPRLFKVDYDRQICHKANYYDMKGNILPFGELVCPPDFTKTFELPLNFQEMVNVVNKLASNIPSPFVRIDLYNVQGNIYFGEITFSPSGGHGKFTNPEWDLKLGEWIDLSVIHH